MTRPMIKHTACAQALSRCCHLSVNVRAGKLGYQCDWNLDFKPCL